MMNGERIKIHQAELVKEDLNSQKNKFIITKKDFKIICENGIIRQLILQKAGKARVSLQEFLNQLN